MKHFILGLLIFFCPLLYAQQAEKNYELQLKTGNYIPSKNLSVEKVAKRQAGYKTYVMIQFYQLPDKNQHASIKAAGINLLNYIPNNAYWASISGTLDSNKLKSLNVRSIESINPAYKTDPALTQPGLPSHAVKEAGRIDLSILYFSDTDNSVVVNELTKLGASILKNTPEYFKIEIRIDQTKIHQVASVFAVSSVAPVAPPVSSDNSIAIANHRTNSLKSNFAGERNLSGSGVVVGLGDEGLQNTHADLQNRVTKTTTTSGFHGDHTLGTIAGAGNINPLYQGAAPKSTVVFDYFGNIIYNATNYYTNNSVRITSNSYGSYSQGEYNNDSRTVDLQITNSSYPDLLHIFSAGNFGPNFRTARGGFQAAKNSLVVGNITETNEINSQSSIGPVADGRLKPEVVGVGTNVISTYPQHNYSPLSGTSMSTPGVSGTVALLYERYKQLHSNNNPNSALIKALVCNTADDIGNPGPDFTFGFGRINARRAVEAMEGNKYFESSVNAGDSSTHSITIPSGTAKVKVMLYWKDPAASTSASVYLVNNLNLRVKNGGTIYYPWILNSSVGFENNNAVRGIDNLNNIEQVTIDNPASGTYSIVVSGSALATGSQSYVIVYEIIQPEIKVTFPYGGENLAPNDNVFIRWDESVAGPFTISYSTNNGTNWTTIASNIASNVGYYSWQVPAVTTGQLLVRVSNGTISGQSVVASSIIGVPTGLTLSTPAAGQRTLSWNAVSGATSYDVYLLSPTDSEMQLVANTTNTNYTLSNITSADFWFSVRAKNTAATGRRAQAINSGNYRTPENPANTISGMKYAYYEGNWSSIPDFSTLTPVKTGTIGSFDYYAIRNRDNNYGIRFTGYFTAAEDGNYTFFVSGRKTARLYIGNTLIAVNTYSVSDEQTANSIALKAGKHAITYDMFEDNTDEFLILAISGPNLTRYQSYGNEFVYSNDNVAPVVSITSPVTGTQFGAPATITINASASDSDGSISKVEFYQGTTKLGEDFSSPYSYEWTNVSTGTYSLTAKAFDNVNATTTSTAVSVQVVANTLPSVSITSPFNGATYSAGSTVTIEATATDTDGTITKVEFYQGTTKLGEDLVSPYSYSWSNVPQGTHSLTAKAIDNLSGVTTSSAISIIVSGPVCTDPEWNASTQYTGGSKVSYNGRKYTANYWNQNARPDLNCCAAGEEWIDNGPCSGGNNVNPTVSLTAPVNGASYTAPASITLSATASDSDGSISKVEFYNGTTFIAQGTLSSGVYSYSWTNVAAGSYTITARAYDNLNASTTSTAASVTVANPGNPLPVVIMTVPANGSSYTAPASVTLKATASDDGSISKVEFYNGSALLGQGTLTSGEYVYSWTNVGVGSYSVTAKAYDNLNATATSSAVTITVSSGGGCSAPQYVENGGYVAGSRVKNNGTEYECKGYPYTAWCNGAAWAYAPGTGTAWGDAWTQIGACREGKFATNYLNVLAMYPNPASQSVTINYVSENAGKITLTIINDLSKTVAMKTIHVSTGDNYLDVNVSDLTNGVYLLQIENEGRVFTKMLSVVK